MLYQLHRMLSPIRIRWAINVASMEWGGTEEELAQF
jgi:hypothetical protein